jgi:hypothetical protein
MGGYTKKEETIGRNRGVWRVHFLLIWWNSKIVLEGFFGGFIWIFQI